jgi:hypothetical protein
MGVSSLYGELDYFRGHNKDRHHGDLDQACDAVRTFRPMSKSSGAVLADENRRAGCGEFYPFKTSSRYRPESGVAVKGATTSAEVDSKMS